MTILGYARVSTPGQDLAMQRDALAKAGAEKLFEDVGTGRNFSRPGLTALLAHLRQGDTLVIWRLDRLGRSQKDLISLVDRITGAGVKVISLHENIDTQTATGRLMLQFFGMMAEFEANLIRERTKAGLDASRAKGIKSGRRRKLDAAKVKEARKMLKTAPLAVVATKLKVSRWTLQRALDAAPVADRGQSDISDFVK
jgi:DNA invertase Pin-like site-specific DNA recombinase